MERRELPRYPVIDAAATGRNLRRLRLEKGYSVKELQEYLGLGCLLQSCRMNLSAVARQIGQMKSSRSVSLSWTYP